MAFVHKIRQVQLVGPQLRKLRKERKLTQTELAARIGIQQSDLSRMEKGEYRVSLDTLFQILAEFDVSIGDFFDEVARESMTPQDVRLIQTVKTMPPEVRREIEDFVDFKKRDQEGRIASEAAAVAKQAEKEAAGG